MGSTHYMDLLMMNSPWNLIFFMAIPVVLAESIAISELYILYKQPTALPSLEKFKNTCGVFAAVAFIAIIIYLVPFVVIPLCEQHLWRTWIDVIAIVSYIAAGLPMIMIGLLNIGLIIRDKSKKKRTLYHILFLSAFLILSHVAMIFGMIDPTIAGWEQENMQEMHHKHQHDHSMH